MLSRPSRLGLSYEVRYGSFARSRLRIAFSRATLPGMNTAIGSGRSSHTRGPFVIAAHAIGSWRTKSPDKPFTRVPHTRSTVPS